MLDAYQSVGSVPLDVTALGRRFRGRRERQVALRRPGSGWLYVRPDLAETLEPTLVGWQAHASPFGFEPSSSTRRARGAS